MWWCGAIGALWFLLRGGWAMLWPSATQAMLTGDFGQHILGFMHFRISPWSFPLGGITTLASPIGTTVGYMDAGNLPAVLFKLLDPWLPVDFQYVGLTLLLFYFLQGVFAYRLSRHVSADETTRVLLAALVVMSPVMIARIQLGHENLCAHFLLFWAADAWLSRARSLPWIAGFAALIHPYFLPFILPLALLRRPLATLMTVTLVLFCFGYFTGASDIGSHGFGHYSSHVLALFAPLGNVEGYAFLGWGGLFLLLCAAVFRRAIRLDPILLALVVGLTAFAMINVELKNDVARALRGNGRFIWAAHYAIIFVAARMVQRRWVLVAAVSLQMVSVPFLELGEPRMGEVPDLDGFARIDLVPPNIIPACRDDEKWPLEKQSALRWGYYAYRAKLPINSAYLARGKREKIASYCASATIADDDALYVLSNAIAAPEHLRCKEIAGLRACSKRF